MFTYVLIGGCKEETPSGSPHATLDSPALHLLGSVTLAESDSSYVAEPAALAVGPDGTFFVADRFQKRVHVFGRDGRFLRGIGSGGRGPGEFNNPGFLALEGDTLLYAVDSSEIEIFDVRTSAHLGSFPMPSRPGVIGVSSGRLFAGYADLAKNGSVARVTRDGSELHVTGPFPFPEFMQNAQLFPMINEVTIALKGDTAATAFTVTNMVYLSDITGSVLDSIWVPARRRNGARPDLLRRLVENPNDRDLAEAALYGSSVPMGLHWLSEGKLALLSTDGRMVDNRFVDSSYVSVIDPRTRRSCVDARVPGPTDPSISVGFRGDTLFVLSQEIQGATQVSTTIQSYRIDTAGCEWVAR